jgi:hypothetical protein
VTIVMDMSGSATLGGWLEPNDLPCGMHPVLGGQTKGRTGGTELGFNSDQPGTPPPPRRPCEFSARPTPPDVGKRCPRRPILGLPSAPPGSIEGMRVRYGRPKAAPGDIAKKHGSGPPRARMGQNTFRARRMRFPFWRVRNPLENGGGVGHFFRFDPFYEQGAATV